MGNAFDVVKRDILQEIARTQEKEAIIHQGQTQSQDLLHLRSQEEGIENPKVLQNLSLPIIQAGVNQVKVEAIDLPLNINEL